MLVYEGIKTSFIEDVDLGIIADKIRTKYIEIIKRRPSPPEFNSWKNSMQYMRGVLNDTEIPNSTGIAIEYNIPPTGCRIDFMISGYKKYKLFKDSQLYYYSTYREISKFAMTILRMQRKIGLFNRKLFRKK